MCKSDIIVPFCVFGFGKLWILYLVFHRRSSSWWRITWQPVSPVGQLRSSLLHSLLVPTYQWMSEIFLGIFGGIFFGNIWGNIFWEYLGGIFFSSFLHSLIVSPFKWMLGYSLRILFFLRPPQSTCYTAQVKVGIIFQEYFKKSFFLLRLAQSTWLTTNFCKYCAEE